MHKTNRIAAGLGLLSGGVAGLATALTIFRLPAAGDCLTHCLFLSAALPAAFFLGLLVLGGAAGIAVARAAPPDRQTA